jgi:hypothetical protein
MISLGGLPENYSRLLITAEGVGPTENFILQHFIA